MMMIFAVTLIWALLSTAGALQCQTCTNSNDLSCVNTTTITCPTQTECWTANIQSSSTPGQILRACAPPAVCPAPGSQPFSFSTSGTFGAINSQCCTTDGCNSQVLAPPTLQSVNNLQCYSCDPTNSNCSVRIQCKGVENRCFRASVVVGSVTSLTLGCASANLCGAASNLSSLGIFPSLSGLTCCDTNVCNSAHTTTTTTTTAFLLLGALAFSLF